MSSVKRADDLAAARQRAAAAYDPDLLAQAGHRLANLLSAHLQAAERAQGVVLPWVDPQALIAEAATFLRSASAATRSRASPAGHSPASSVGDRPPDSGEARCFATEFGALVEVMLARGLNLHDPRYLGHQVPAPIPVAGLFDCVGSVTNQVMAIYEMGPWATAVEQALVQELGTIIGWEPGAFAGLVTHGGSLANLTALLAARNLALAGVWENGLSQATSLEKLANAPLPAAVSPAAGRGKAGSSLQAAPDPPVLVAHQDAHYSVARAAGILGLGSRQVVRVGLDSRGRMDPRQLHLTLTTLKEQGRVVVAVVACACATPTGAFDPLEQVAEVCRHHHVWLHVDAAHGGSALFSRHHRHLLAGIEQADSVVWDAHKMLFVPGLCAFVFYRNKEHQFEAFRQDAPYLFDPAAPGLAEYDSGLKTLECTKRAAAFALWGVWALFGRQLFADLVDITFDLGRALYERLVSAPDFAPLHEPEANIVAFRHVPAALKDAPPARIGAFQLELRRRLVESGEFYIVPLVRDGVGALRVTLSNPLTTESHLDQLLEALRQHGQGLLAAQPG